jgi:hypothetical protein
MAKINIFNLTYLFFRLAPFILVCYFTLQSIFNQDIKGLIYLLGLLAACFMTVLVGSFAGFEEAVGEISDGLSADQKTAALGEKAIRDAKCNLLTLGENGPISNLPLSQSILGYTLAYLSYFIGMNHLEASNIPTFVVIPLMIVADFVWNLSNECSQPKNLLIALIVGGGIGALWAFIIDQINEPQLMYISGTGNASVCTKPQTGVLRCRKAT